MGFKFFYLPKHRVFNYQPMYYDPDKEKLERGIAKRDSEGKYIPGSIVSGGFRRVKFGNLPRKDGAYTKGRRIAVYLLLAGILAALFYFSKMFSHMLALLKIQIDP